MRLICKSSAATHSRQTGYNLQQILVNFIAFSRAGDAYRRFSSPMEVCNGFDVLLMSVRAAFCLYSTALRQVAFLTGGGLGDAPWPDANSFFLLLCLNNAKFGPLVLTKIVKIMLSRDVRL